MTKVHVLAVGGFGEAVADRLCRERADLEVSTDQAGSLELSASWPDAGLRVLASWREVPRLAEVLDARSADWGTPWFPVLAEHPRLRVGPLVVPGTGACYRCFRKRRAQHERDAAHVATLHAHYETSPGAGPGGFLPHHVDMAAGMALDVLRRFDTGDAEGFAGTVRHWHLLEQHLSGGRVVALHGCTRCRRRREVPAESTWADLARDLTPLLAPLDEGVVPTSDGPPAASSTSARQ
ncbi:TOMM precursor leader peptide-binding protein [Streptomyces yangpuensis]|uniref:TOMM precursor leader peptide-binding protein n=1 Tax=Streptomyces yangpuensis TaxID=1648182 RepID=UPI000699CCB3|nr:TOMM precursor leader peptide-binding protein [Streptomyces yangpuensis]